MNSSLKTKFLIACAALVLPFSIHAQTYKVGDKHPGGGWVVEVDGSGKKGLVIDEADSGPYTPPEAISAAQAKAGGWSVPYIKHLRVAYVSIHKAGSGNFAPALYQSVDASSPQYRRGLNFADGTESTGIAQNNKVLVRFVKKFEPDAVASSVFPLARETRFELARKYPSPSGKHYLIYQADGNLVVYTAQDNKPVWAIDRLTPNTWRKGAGGYAVFQSDGNLATYQADKGFVWSARHVPSPAGTTLTLNEHGQLQIIGPDAKVLWTGTATH